MSTGQRGQSSGGRTDPLGTEGNMPHTTTGFPIHTLETSPPYSQGLLRESETSLGFIPNLYGVMAESPPVLEAYQTLYGLFNHSSFSAEEKTVVWQTINRIHNCRYCQAAHGVIAEMTKVDTELNTQLVQGQTLDDARLECLRQTTEALVNQRGDLTPSQLDAFYRQGYERKHLLEIVLGISQKVMSNYTNHLAETPIDSAFQAYRSKGIQ